MVTETTSGQVRASIFDYIRSDLCEDVRSGRGRGAKYLFIVRTSLLQITFSVMRAGTVDDTRTVMEFEVIEI
jgi:hypothetical protein